MAGQSPGAPRHSWRATQSKQASPTSSKRGRRLIYTLLVVALFGIFGVLLIRPLFRPVVHLVCLPVSNYSDLNAPPIAYVQNDFDAFKVLEDRLYSDDKHPVPDKWEDLRNSAAMNGLGKKLSGLVKGKREVLILYLSAHGTSDDGTAYLLCSDFDPAKPDAGRYKLSEVLDQISQCQAKLKLLILDSGRISGDTRLGMVFNEFPTLLQEVVKGCPDRDLWVLNANSVLETSHVWHAQRRSVFGHFVAEGLKGQADGSIDDTHDGAIDLAELFHYVNTRVSAWVAKYGDNGETQTPMLLRGDLGLVDELPRNLDLMPAPRKSLFAGWRSKKKDAPESDGEQQTNPDESKEPADSKKALLHSPRNQPTFLANVSQDTAQKTGSDAPASPGAQDTGKEKAAPAQAPPKDDTKPASGDGSKSGTPKDPGAPADQTPDAAAAPQKQKDPPKADAAQPKPPEPSGESQGAKPDDTATLLEKAWKLRDEVQDRKNRWSPVDYAPHLWRDYLELLLTYESLHRFGVADGSRDLSKLIEQKILALDKAMRTRESVRGGSKSIVERIVLAYPQSFYDRDNVRSLAMAELMVAPGDESEIQKIAGLASAFDAHVNKLSGDDFRKWLSGLSPQYGRLVEINLAQRLEKSSVANDWKAVRVALETSRLAERAAAYREWCGPWVQAQVNAADEYRLAGERDLLSGSREAERGAATKLEHARGQYQSARTDVQRIDAAIRLRNELLLRAPYYVRWFAQANRDRPSSVPPFDEISQLLDGLPKLVDALDAMDPKSAEVVEAHKKTLEETQKRIESSLQASYIDSLLNSVTSDPRAKGNARKIEDLLSTPLLAGAQRKRLLQALQSLEPNALDSEIERYRSIVSPKKSLSDDDQKRVAKIAELERKLVRLADGDSANGPGQSGDYRELGKSLQLYYRELPAAIQYNTSANSDLSDRTSRPERIVALRRAEHALRLVDARDAETVKDEPNAIEQIRQAGLFDLLEWHVKRFDDAQSGPISSADTQFLTSAAQATRKLARIPGQPSPDAPTELAKPKFVLDGKTSINLSGPEPQLLELSLSLRGNPASVGTPAVTLQFEEGLLEIRFVDGDQSVATGKPMNLKSVLPILRFQIRARMNPDVVRTEAKVNVQVAAAGAQPGTHETTVGLPVRNAVQVVAKPKISGTTTGEKMATVLKPFPNNTTDYTFELLNITDKAQTVAKVELFAWPSPRPGERRVRDLFDPSGNLRPGLTTEQLAVTDKPVAIPPTERHIIEFKPFKPEPPKEGPSAKFGLIWVITDDKGKKITQAMDISPLRPREYVQPQVSYDSDMARINVSVKPRPGAPFPATGSKIHIDIFEAPDLKTSRKPDDEVADPNFEGTLFVRVDPNPKTTVSFGLTVDDYPRAFVYRVTCGENQPKIEPAELQPAIRFTAPENNSAFLAPTDLVPARFEVDAPDHAFMDEANYLEVGIDVDGDGDFRNERPLKLFNNRQFDVRVSEVTAEGLIKFKTAVRDFTVDVPANRLANVRVNVLGRLTIDGDLTFSQPRPLQIYLDETPPKIAKIIAEPAMKGEDIAVSVRVADLESGVQSVELAFEDESGKFPKEPPPIRAEHPDKSTDLWKGSIPTGNKTPGQHTLLVRATNSVGVQTKPEPVDVTIMAQPKPKVAAPAGPSTSTVKGRVFVNDDPLAAIKVVLTDLSQPATTDKPPLETKTNSKGEFVFEDVPGGKYQLSAKGNPKNLVRELTDQKTITVKPPSPITQDLKLK